MLKIRLQRVGRRHEPVFRVVVVDSHAGPKAGKAVEVIGSYDPRFNKSQIKGDRVKHWMSVGAQISPSLNNILVSEKIIEGKKINVLPKKTIQTKETPSDSGEEKASSDEQPVEAPAENSEEPKVGDADDSEPRPPSPDGSANGGQAKEEKSEEPVVEPKPEESEKKEDPKAEDSSDK